MYWFHDAEYCAAKATMIDYLNQGYRWDVAVQIAGVIISRATAYRLWLRAWQEGPTYLDDGRHGHPSKLRAAPPLQPRALAVVLTALLD